MPVLDIIICGIFAFLIYFTWQMRLDFLRTEIEQTALISGVYGFSAAELCFCWRIKAKKMSGKTDAEAISEAVKEHYGEKATQTENTVDLDNEGGVEG